MKTGFFILGLICSLIEALINAVTHNFVMLTINCVCIITCSFAIGIAIED